VPCELIQELLVLSEKYKPPKEVKAPVKTNVLSWGDQTYMVIRT